MYGNSVAASVRRSKENRPQDFCPECLWNIGRSGPCPKHQAPEAIDLIWALVNSLKGRMAVRCQKCGLTPQDIADGYNVYPQSQSCFGEPWAPKTDDTGFNGYPPPGGEHEFAEGLLPYVCNTEGCCIGDCPNCKYVRSLKGRLAIPPEVAT